MPLPGGASDKLGNQYERSWTVSRLIEILLGSADSLRIEDPTVFKCEFVVSGSRREFHQAKRATTSGKWSLAGLGLELQLAMFKQLVGNDAIFIFVSGSDAPELRELSERARNSSSSEHFQSEFLKGKLARKSFDALRELWGHPSPEQAFDVLRRIFVRTQDQRSIDDGNALGLRALFLADPQRILDILARLVDVNVHKHLSSESIFEALRQEGYTPRALASPDSAEELIRRATNSFCDSARGRLIQNELLPRAQTQQLLESIDENPLGIELVVTGKAGTGKSVVTLDLVDALRKKKIPTLAFRLDRLGAASTATDIGRQLGLEESPAFVLGEIAAERGAVLVIDQLDAISATSGRGGDLFDGVASLLADIRATRKRHQLHVVLVCREFDWNNDHRFRQILLSSHKHVAIGELPETTLAAVLAAAGCDASRFQKRQLDLLKLPQNLALYLEGRPDTKEAPAFHTASELFMCYWKAKRKAVESRAGMDSWMNVIQALCDEITKTQHLFVIREKLDQVNSTYIDQMASEGVITFDGKLYAFGHESFFDYSYARLFVSRSESLVTALEQGEQHLFRRAQVRQVLTYLRDTDRDRYLKELEQIITSPAIRPHIKDLAIAWVMSLEDPADDEWLMFRDRLQAGLFANSEKDGPSDRILELIANRFWLSRSWFDLADRHAMLSEWLNSADESRLDALARYFSFHQRFAGARIAELLDFRVGTDEKWRDRLRHIVEWSSLEQSPEFLRLVLRLIDNGTLDDARGPIAQNSTFWSLLYGLSKKQPAWTAEIAAHWLSRRIAIAGIGKSTEDGLDTASMLFGNDEFASEPIARAAESAPLEFATEVVPLILQISDSGLHRDRGPPLRDRVWYDPASNQFRTISSAFLHGCASSLAAIAASQPELAIPFIDELSKRSSYVGNFLLLKLLQAGGVHFSDRTVELMCEQPWRLECGRSGSPHAIARELIAQIAPVCRPENLERLQVLLVNYLPKFETTADGRQYRGSASYDLLTAIPESLLTDQRRGRLLELERKFGPFVEPEVSGGADWVQSPIPADATSRMNDDDWLGACAKYASDDRLYSRSQPYKGGANQLSGELQRCATAEPERFAKLIARFPDDVNPTYVSHLLMGLGAEDVQNDPKLQACSEAARRWRTECGGEIADLIGKLVGRLPDDILALLTWLAIEHPDPEHDAEPRDGDAFGTGISTVRGRAALAVNQQLHELHDERLIALVERLVKEPNTSVRACVASTLIAVARRDMDHAIRLLLELIGTEDTLLSVEYVQRLVNYALRDYWPQLKSIIERMLRSSVDNIANGGARMAALASFYHDDAKVLVEEAWLGSIPQRLGIAQVAAANLAIEEIRPWCIQQLRKCFNDPASEIRKEAAAGFRQLESIALTPFGDLIRDFCDSPAFADDSFTLIHVLDETKELVPGIACAVADRFLDRFSAEARDFTRSRGGDAYALVPLIFRVYHQHQRDEWAKACLDTIDRVCLERVHSMDEQFETYER